MKLIGAFFRLIRWQNLFFIIITQVLFYTCIIQPSLRDLNSIAGSNLVVLDPPLFLLLALSSVLIAAAGYIINDYFDLNIDQINKPGSIVIQRLIKRRWAIVWHLIFSAIGVILAFYISWKLLNPVIGFANLGCVFLLWLYSTTFKKQLLIGNILISLLTAWVILVLYFAELNFSGFRDPLYRQHIRTIFKFSMIYAGFAFIISLIREVIKDMEDRDGDARYGCKTMPIVWGIPATKMFVAVWLFVLTAALIIMQLYGLLQSWWHGAIYCLVAVIIPLIRISLDIKKAVTTADYHQLSSRIKWIMLAGILSMIFFKWYL